MTHKNGLSTPTLILLLITLACICPIVNATQTIPLIIEPTTLNFIDSQHFKEKTIQIDGYTHYISQPDLKTIIDYIFTQSPTLLNQHRTQIYLNIKDHGFILNREVIAYSRYLKYIEDEDKEFPIIDLNQTPTTLSIDEIIKQKNTLPSQLLIAKTTGLDIPIGVYINLNMINQLEPELPSKFKWISTYSNSKRLWLNTIYKKPVPKEQLN